MVNSIGAAAHFHPDFGWMYAGQIDGIPYCVVSGSQPKVSVTIDAFKSESDLLPVPFPSNATDPNSDTMEGDPLTGSQNTSDRHMLIYDKDNQILYELYNAHRPSEEADGQWHADAEAVWYTNKDYFRTPGYTSADAAGLPVLPGLVTYDEVASGVIDHALRFTVKHTRDSYIFPASHYASSDSNSALPRMGERFRLKASFDISSYPADDQVILTALKTYGMMVADNGSNWFLSGAPDSRWNVNDLNLLKNLVGSDFEAVDLTPEVTAVSPSSGSTGGGTNVIITGYNFSGGAGLTKVYFGATQATSFTIVSDTQITVTAPAHAAGTVDITVQAGYGTSSTSNADQFTYGSTSGATQLAVTGFPGSITAGTSGTFTVTAEDASGNVVTGYTGTVHFTSSDSLAVVPADYTFVAADNGVHTFSATLKTASTESLTATDTATSTITGSQSGITVTPASASTLTVTGFPASTTAGVSGSFTVTAKDAYGNTATGYTGTVHFTSSDSQAVLPGNYTFVTSDNGMHTFNANLKTAGTQSLTGTDTATSTITGSETGITVVPAAASTLSVTGFPSAISPGVSGNFTVAAKDPYGNTAKGYTGTVQFTSSDTLAALPSNYTFVAADNGVHTFAATLQTVGTQSLTATDTVTSSITGSETGISVVLVNALRVTGFPSPTTAGASGTLTVSAIDSNGNVVTSYAGTVHFTSSDTLASLPANYTFTSSDKGVHTFTVTLKRAGTRSVTATDTVNSTITGSQSGITVNPAAATKLVVSGFPSSITAGKSGTFTVTAKDAYGNTATGYTGTVTFTSSDPQAVLPANYTFTAADNGVHSFTAILKTAGTQSITATDTSTKSITGSEKWITVGVAAASTFTFSAPASVVHGQPFSVTITAVDAYGNTVPGFNHAVHFKSSDPKAALPADYTYTSSDKGVHTFTITLNTVGAETITVDDVSLPSHVATLTLTVT
jgi:hypothetical protein